MTTPTHLTAYSPIEPSHHSEAVSLYLSPAEKAILRDAAHTTGEAVSPFARGTLSTPISAHALLVRLETAVVVAQAMKPIVRAGTRDRAERETVLRVLATIADDSRSPRVVAAVRAEVSAFYARCTPVRRSHDRVLVYLSGDDRDRLEAWATAASPSSALRMSAGQALRLLVAEHLADPGFARAGETGDFAPLSRASRLTALSHAIHAGAWGATA